MARYHMVLVHRDRSEEAIGGEDDDLERACRRAFKIATAAGRPGWRGGAPRPDWVTVYRGDALELSIQVTSKTCLEHRPAP